MKLTECMIVFYEFSDNMDTFSANLYHRLNDQIEGGIQAQYKSGEQTTLSIGSRYLINSCTAVRAKVNNDAMVGVSLESKIREGMCIPLT